MPAIGRFPRAAVTVPWGYLSLQIFLPSLRVVLLRLGFPLVHKCFVVNLVPFSALWFIFRYFKRWIHKEFAACILNHVLFIFFLNNFIASVFAFRYLYYLGFIFLNFLILCITVIDLHIWENCYIPGINTT